jgi:hypothetical protein
MTRISHFGNRKLGQIAKIPSIVDIHQELCVRKAGYPGDLHLPVLLPTGMIISTK